LIVPLDGIALARLFLAGGRHALTGGFTDFAARDAHLAAFNAAWAYVVHRTGRRPKTHAGA
jgi:hypothetical protein